MRLQLGENKRVLAVVVPLVAALVIAAGGYVVLISPQRSKVSDLDREIGTARSTIDEYRAQSRSRVKPLQFAELFSLTKAMPDQEDMPGVLLELSRVAADSGVVLQSVVPKPAVPATGYSRLPLEIVVEGNFYDVSDFLYRLRTLVAVHDGELAAAGRLFSVESLEFVEGLSRFPELQAKSTLSAFVYGGGASQAAPGAPVPAPAPTPAPTEGAATALGAEG